MSRFNPFLIEGYKSPEYFCDRIEDTLLLKEHISNQRNVALISKRRLGKSGLIHHFFNQEDIKKNYHTFYIDIYDTKNLTEFTYEFGKCVFETLKPLGRQVWETFTNILKSLKMGVSFDINGMPEWGVSIGDIHAPDVLLDEIFKYLEHSGKPSIVAFDEFQVIANYPEKTVVITDSGDNCGAGGYGQNTIVLREMLKHKTDKKVLFAGINDPKSYDIISKCEVGEKLTLNVGVEEDADSKSVRLEGTLKAVGKQQKGFSSDFDLGKSYLFNVSGTNIDVIIMNDNIQYGTMEQFDVANAPFHDYDIVVVKMGYLDTYLIPETKFHIMALSDGPTIQRSERIPFKMIARPMWPMDEFEDLYFIK